MRLHYRGVAYEKEPFTLEVVKGEVGGKYRGKDWFRTYPRHIPHLRPKSSIQYRGVAYGAPVSTPSLEQTAPISKKLAFTVVKEAEKTHLESIRRSLERRLQVAEASGNQSLVLLLQQEFKAVTS